MSTMRVARLYEAGKPFKVETIPTPEPGYGDVRVRVKACGLIPNLKNVVGGQQWYVLPPLPAVYGLDAAGVIDACGPGVFGFKPGDRVYMNPLLSCGGCHYCQSGRPLNCESFTLRAYFSTGPNADQMQERYPYGGLSEYMTASVGSLVKLPDSVSFEQGARFGYLGTSYRALKAGGMAPGKWVLVNGVTGTLGVGTVQLALAMGATRILGIGRNRDVMARLEALAPGRVHCVALGDQPIPDWVKGLTEGVGAEILIDCQGAGASVDVTNECIQSLQRGGRGLFVGATVGDAKANYLWLLLTTIQFGGSVWFTTDEGREMAELAGQGVLDLSSLETKAFPLDQINEAFALVIQRLGGFTNVVVTP